MHTMFFATLITLALCSGEAVAGPTYRSLTPASGRVLVDHASATAAVLTEFTDSDSFTVSIDHSGDAWEGRYYHYNGVDAETGKPEQFSVYIIDHDDFTDEFSIPAPVVPSNITALSIRRPASWVCSWYYACVNAAVYTASISANQATAVKNAINARLRANNNELMKLLVQGIGLTFSVGILNGITDYYITNRLQGTSDKSIATDVCVINDDWKQRIAQIQADIEEIKKAIQSGDSRPRTFVHVSTEQTQGVDGHAVAHGVKATQVSNDFQPLTC